jgi:hypothetical protein
MSQPEMRIADASAAASAFAAFARLSGASKLPSDPEELSAKLSRATGRARPLAIALGKFVENHGFDALQSAIGERPKAAREAKDIALDDAQAAATLSAISFEALDRTAMMFASSGLY